MYSGRWLPDFEAIYCLHLQEPPVRPHHWYHLLHYMASHPTPPVLTMVRASYFTQTVSSSTDILNAVLKECTQLSVLLHVYTLKWTRLSTHIKLLADMHITKLIFQLHENGSCYYILVPQSTTLWKCMWEQKCSCLQIHNSGTR
jgi:hypothetical protein